MQIESISKSDSILNSGAHDLRADNLLTSIDPFFDIVARLMEEQPQVPPATLSREELSLLKLRIKDSLTLLEDLRVPNTLGHLDLNSWNLVVSTDGCVFLDWAEAYVGPPFFSFEYLLQHFRRDKKNLRQLLRQATRTRVDADGEAPPRSRLTTAPTTNGEKSPLHSMTGILANKRRKLVLTPVGVEKVTSISRIRFNRSVLEEGICLCGV